APLRRLRRRRCPLLRGRWRPPARSDDGRRQLPLSCGKVSPKLRRRPATPRCRRRWRGGKLRDFLERHRRPFFEGSGERGMRELPSGTVTFLSNDVAHLSPFQVLVASYLGLKRLSGCRV